MRARQFLRLCAVLALTAGVTASAVAQTPAPATREAEIEHAQAEKSTKLHPYVVSRGERLMAKADSILAGTTKKWHPFFESAYTGGGFGYGVGYAQFVSPYNVLDLRGSYTAIGYKRAEAEFSAPRLFHRRGSLTVLGGWREATQVPFFGIGSDTAKDSRVYYGFRQPYGSALLTVWPTRRYLMLRGGFELTQWRQEPGHAPSVDTRFNPLTLPGLGANVTYAHTQGTAGFDWRTSPGYSRRGGFYGITVHDYADPDDRFGFRQTDYEAIQHVPILREAWVLSFHALAVTTTTKTNQQIPFFMFPRLGSGHTLRGFESFRFRDRNSLLLQGEWRIMVNRFMDTALFYDTGKVTEHTSDLDFRDLKNSYGFGVRFHSPFQTAFRVDLARSSEGLRLVINTSAPF